jgi:glycosyltransferase involved in cell wall biosynthesis
MMRKIYQWVLRAAAISVLSAVYGTAARFSRRCNRRGSGSWQRSDCILVIGTFHNPNWFHSHIRPLVRCGIGAVVLVCDEVVEPVNRVQFECPPRWMTVLLSRAVAKFVWAVRCAIRYRPDLYMGYHIFPGAVTALVVARLFNRPACYQDTSGPLELEGGGWHAENRILTALQWPSAYVERLACAVVREFDSVVVRGSGAEAYIRETGYRGSLAVITGSVEPPGAWRDFSERTIDLAFVGRLAEYKRPERFIAVVAAVAKALPGKRAVLIGDGPDVEILRSLVRELGIESMVEFLGKRADVNDLLAITRVFVLTSRWEGLSIAMLEAMAAGAVPVVANVGDLADLIEDDVNGFLVAQDDIAGYSREAVRLLSSEDRWRRYSKRAVESALANSGSDAIAKRWDRHLRPVIARSREASGIACANNGHDVKVR